MMKLGIAVGLWFVAALVATGNGYVGNIFVAARLGQYGAHVYKTVVLVIVIFVLAWLYARITQGAGWVGAAWGAGVLWVGLTIVFEFIVGHYVFGNSWDILFADYKIWEGRLWSLVLLSSLVGPPTMAWLLNR